MIRKQSNPRKKCKLESYCMTPRQLASLPRRTVESSRNTRRLAAVPTFREQMELAGKDDLIRFILEDFDGSGMGDAACRCVARQGYESYRKAVEEAKFVYHREAK